MKKIISLLCAMALLTTVLAACSSTTPSSSSSESSASSASSESTSSEETSASSEAESEESSATEGGELNLFTWAGMFPDEVLEGFEAETGIKINYSNFDTDETMLSKLQTAGGGEYDLIIADDYIIETAIAEELVQPLDKDEISNLGNVNPIYQGQFYDPEDMYTVPYGAGVVVIVYYPAAVDFEITSYEDLWNPALEGSVGIIGNPRVVNGVTLLSMGESMNTEDLATITAAGDKLLELAPNIRLIKDSNLQDDLLSGEISVGLMYMSQATLAMMNNPELKVVFPEEKLGFGIMASFVPVNAPNADAAHQFLDYILQPENAKLCYEWLGYFSANKAADALIDESLQQYLVLPEEFKQEDMEMIENISLEASEEHIKVWTAFQNAAQ